MTKNPENSDPQIDKLSKGSAIPIWKLNKTGAKKTGDKIRISVSETQFTRIYFDKISNAVQSHKDFRFDDMKVGLQTFYIIWKVLANDCFVIDLA